MRRVNTKILKIETSVARPNDIQIFRGESVPVEIHLANYGVCVDVADLSAEFYYQSSDMGDHWYKADAGHLSIDPEDNTITVLWADDLDAGADRYTWFLRAYDGTGDDSYRAFGHIEMMGSPSLNPGVVPIPTVILDFDEYEVIHAPYYTKAETDEAIAEAISGIPVPVYPVTSVNGKTGAVVLSASDVGALPSTYVAPVASVNGKTGAVVLSASDVGAATVQYVDGAVSAKADRSDLALYLPLSGGTVDALTIDSTLSMRDTETDATILTAGSFFFFAGGELRGRLTIPVDTGNNTIARTLDVYAATSGKADASALSAYYTSAQTNTAISTAITSAIGTINTALDSINGEVI